MPSRRRRGKIRVVPMSAALVVLCSVGCVQRVNINGHSMEPTLTDGSWAIVDRAISRINRGDIVAFKWPRDESKNFLQRIVGLPGERIEMKEGRVAIDGRPLEESYVVEANRSHDTWGPLLIPAGEYFTMGDNRRNSSDSRTWGTVKRDRIWAMVMVR